MAARKKDVVLMATVTSFEAAVNPGKSELKQFAELFVPLFLSSSDEAKRQAVAALSQCPHVPAPVALFIGSQPIGIAAPFLTGSEVIDDDTLIAIAQTQGAAHAKAIVRREALSPKVIDALVGLRHFEPRRPMAAGETVAPSALTGAQAPKPAAAAEAISKDDAEEARRAREEKLRNDLRQIARHLVHDEGDRLGLRSLSDMQGALLVRFAREHEAGNFVTTLADALSSSRWRAERIMLDLSGQQLATTLKSLGMGFADGVFILEHFYPHLAEQQSGASRAWRLLDGIDPNDCNVRVEAWLRADRYTYLAPGQVGAQPEDSRQRAERRDIRLAGAAR